MLSRRLVLGVAALVAVAGCGDDGDGDGDAGARLADRVVAVLEANPVAAVGDVGAAEVVCPDVDDPQPGDRATCRVELPDGRIVDVDVEFGEDDALAVVAVAPR